METKEKTKKEVLVSKLVPLLLSYTQLQSGLWPKIAALISRIGQLYTQLLIISPTKKARDDLIIECEDLSGLPKRKLSILFRSSLFFAAMLKAKCCTLQDLRQLTKKSDRHPEPIGLVLGDLELWLTDSFFWQDEPLKAFNSLTELCALGRIKYGLMVAEKLKEVGKKKTRVSHKKSTTPVSTLPPVLTPIRVEDTPDETPPIVDSNGSKDSKSVYSSAVVESMTLEEKQTLLENVIYSLHQENMALSSIATAIKQLAIVDGQSLEQSGLAAIAKAVQSALKAVA